MEIAKRSDTIVTFVPGYFRPQKSADVSILQIRDEPSANFVYDL